MWYTEPSKPLNLQKVQESPIRGGIIEESINDTHKWEAERMARNILVVEDDRNISDLIRMYLEKEGFEVRSAYDGGKAVEEFDKQAPDMVLLDIMLPVMTAGPYAPTSGKRPRPPSSCSPPKARSTTGSPAWKWARTTIW